jgi:hypothetical protein
LDPLRLDPLRLPLRPLRLDPLRLPLRPLRLCPLRLCRLVCVRLPPLLVFLFFLVIGIIYLKHIFILFYSISTCVNK